jgi:hypothetical protein
VFLVNSRLGLVTAAPSSSTGMPLHPTGAPLLPKLRGQFAEFLDDGSLVHLGMLYQPTCVGLRYGHHLPSLEPFLDSPASIRPAWPFPAAPSTHLSVIAPGDLPPRTPYRLGGLAPPDLAPCIAHHSIGQGWGRNLNLLSIAYAFPPRLRPASPAVDKHRCGTLGHSVGRFLTPLSLLMPTFALVTAPGRLTTPLLRR